MAVMADADYADAIRAAVEEVLPPITTRWTNPASNRAPIAIEVNLIAPTGERPFYTLFTTGMGTRPMTVTAKHAGLPAHAELLLALPATWFGSDVDAAIESHDRRWPIELLRDLARYPHDHAEAFGAYHTIANMDRAIDREKASPYAPSTRTCCALLGPPLLWPRDLRTLRVGDREVHFYAVVPITEDETTLAREMGGAALWRMMHIGGVTELLQLDRTLPRRLRSDSPSDEDLEVRNHYGVLVGIDGLTALTTNAYLEPLAENVPRVRTTPPASETTLRPMTGEVVGLPHARWLDAIGASNVLHELFTVKCGDPSGRIGLARLRAFLGAAGIDVVDRDGALVLRPLTDDEVRARSVGEVELPETLDETPPFPPTPRGLLCERTFGTGAERYDRTAHIELAMPVVHPWFGDRPITALPVFPAAYRPIVPLPDGRFATADANDLYRRVMLLNAELRDALARGAPTDELHEQLRADVEAVLRNGDSGTSVTIGMRPLVPLRELIARDIRNLTRRVNYSGALHAREDSSLDVRECALPEAFAAELFAPFGALDAAIEERPVILAATRCLGAVQPMVACKVVLSRDAGIGLARDVLAMLRTREGRSISVHVPLSDAAIGEARELLCYQDDDPEVTIDTVVGWLGRARDEHIVASTAAAARTGEPDLIADLASRLLLGRIC